MTPIRQTLVSTMAWLLIGLPVGYLISIAFLMAERKGGAPLVGEPIAIGIGMAVVLLVVGKFLRRSLKPDGVVLALVLPASLIIPFHVADFTINGRLVQGFALDVLVVVITLVVVVFRLPTLLGTLHADRRALKTEKPA